MPADFWNSSQLDVWCAKDYSRLCESVTDEKGSESVPSESVCYLINSIDSLSDQLPKFVRNSYLHYTAMVYAQRYLQVILADASTAPNLDGQLCCEIATLCLLVAIEADGRTITQSVWDSAVIKVFPCEVVHRGIHSAVDAGKGAMIELLGFDPHIHHPFETLGLILADLTLETATPALVSNIALGIVNSLYRTTAVVEYPPYVVAIAAVTGALLVVGEPAVEKWLASLPVDTGAVDEILTAKLYPYIKNREIPLPSPPAVEDLPSPSARTGRSVSRQSSRTVAPSTRSAQATGSHNKRKREQPTDILSSLAWALLPRDSDENAASSNRPTSNHRRPVALSELRVLREISRLSPPAGLVKLIEVKLYSSAEEVTYRTNMSGGQFVVNGLFDCTGTQFDSIVRLLAKPMDLVNVVEQLLTAVNFLNELKVCHFSIEPKNIMISGSDIKIASLSTCSVLPTVPTDMPSLHYRSPELLLGSTGGVRDDPLAVDVWSVGCVIAEIARIFSTRNRYEEPLFKLNDGLPDRVPHDSKCPVADLNTYTNCRMLMRIACCLNMGVLPGPTVWPGLSKRGNYDNTIRLTEYRKKKVPDRNVFASSESHDDLKSYLKESGSEDGIVTEIVKALLRWCPERRASPRQCLSRIIKFKLIST